MRIWQALQHASIRRLWVGQVFSAVGDEIYMMALVWCAAELVGLDAGLVAAVQAASVFVFGVVGGLWADHLDHRRVMIVSDVIRGLAVLLIPITYVFAPITLWILLPVAVLVASLSALFNPALKAILPSLVDEPSLVETTNGLMETTGRFARVVGPGLLSVLGAFLPMVHYFTVNAVSFFVSAWTIRRLPVSEGAYASEPHGTSWHARVLAGYRLTRQSKMITFVIWSGALTSAAWLFVYPLGIALLVRTHITADVNAFAQAIFAYGIGNLASNLLFSNVTTRNPGRLLFTGELIAGVGFFLLAASSNLSMVMIANALAAIGGPMTDIGLFGLLRRRFRGQDLARIYRFNMAICHGCLLVALICSPWIMKHTGVPFVIAICAGIIFLSGAFGFWCQALWPERERPTTAELNSNQSLIA